MNKFESTEEFLDFINEVIFFEREIPIHTTTNAGKIIGIDRQTSVDYAIKKGYVKQTKVERAEQLYKKYASDDLYTSTTVGNDLIMALYEAIQELKREKK